MNQLSALRHGKAIISPTGELTVFQFFRRKWHLKILCVHRSFAKLEDVTQIISAACELPLSRNRRYILIEETPQNVGSYVVSEWNRLAGHACTPNCLSL